LTPYVLSSIMEIEVADSVAEITLEDLEALENQPVAQTKIN